MTNRSHPLSLPPSLPSCALDTQEFGRYKERMLKAENQLVNSLGFDFMIEHPFHHSNDLVDYLCEEGEARGCHERKLCVLCLGPGVCRKGSKWALISATSLVSVGSVMPAGLLPPPPPPFPTGKDKDSSGGTDPSRYQSAWRTCVLSSSTAGRGRHGMAQVLSFERTT